MYFKNKKKTLKLTKGEISLSNENFGFSQLCRGGETSTLILVMSLKKFPLDYES